MSNRVSKARSEGKRKATSSSKLVRFRDTLLKVDKVGKLIEELLIGDRK